MPESAMWTCMCDRKWYTCAVHKAYQRPIYLPTSKRKRCHTHGPDIMTGKVPKMQDPIPHELMKEDIARSEGRRRRLQSQRDDIVLGNAQRANKSPRLLGPTFRTFRKRFAPDALPQALVLSCTLVFHSWRTVGWKKIKQV